MLGKEIADASFFEKLEVILQPTTQPTVSMSYMNFRVLWQSPPSCKSL
jgi:hypothetical protein